MKRCLFALLAVSTLTFTGCCWWPSWGGNRGCCYGGGYNTYGGGYYGQPSGGNCPGGACGPSSGGGYVMPQSSYYQQDGGTHAAQLGVPQPIDGPVTTMPAGYYGGPVTHTAAMPLESLPTF